MTRLDLQRLARLRLREAKALLAARRWSGAYYLAGYAVECALKACIIKRLMTIDQFPERRFSEQCWTHNLVQLLDLAGLTADLATAMAADQALRAHWVIVREWTEGSRYVRTARRIAEDLYSAITDKNHGVFPWIKQRW